MQTNTPDQILCLNAVLDRTGLSRSTLYRKIAEGTFPAQVKISSRRAGWYKTDIDHWLSNPMGYCSGDPDPAPDSREDEHVALEALVPGAAMVLLPVILPVALQAEAPGGRSEADHQASRP